MTAVPLRQPDSLKHAFDAPAARRVTVLGATGSIGTSTLDLVRRARERFTVEAVTANGNVDALARVAREFNVRFAAIADATRYAELKAALAGTGIEIGAGEAALVHAAERSADWVMAAMSGAAGLKPALAAVERGAIVALANKECLVCAGDVFMRRAAQTGAHVLPVDSEHNALFQAMSAGDPREVVRVILTASGGPFRTWSREAIERATPEQALRHPNWAMGRKITIDSATMMNKGLEIIEAHHLFGFGSDRIDVLVHPQSIVHGLVEYADRSVIAQMGAPDMRTPIAHCLAWPNRMPGPSAALDLAQLGQLTFEQPDPERFPALTVARQALTAGGAMPTVLNAANEIAVAAFLDHRLPFGGIARLVAATMEAYSSTNSTGAPASADEALSVDHMARNSALGLLPQIAAKAF